MKYYPWLTDDNDDSFAWIDNFPSDISEERYMLDKGVSAKEWFPENSVIDLEKGTGIRVADAIPNYDNFLIISEKLKKILTEKSKANFEYFPIKIRDHEGHIVKSDYYIANLLDTIECVNMKTSEYRMDPIIKTQVERFKRLVLDETKLKNGAKIFRLKEKTNLIIVDDVLSDEIVNAGCTGMFFQEMEDYGAVFRD
jgi:hypothetical protein